MRLRVVYIGSLLVLGILVTFTIFQPMAGGEQYSEVQRAQLLEQEDRWIIEFDLLNHEGAEAEYAIEVLAGDRQYLESVRIEDGGMFTYIHHLYPDSIVNNNEVSLAVYRDGESAPLEQTTYFLG